MGGTFAKKELEKKKAKQRQDKAEKMKERKLNKEKGKSLEEMMAYLDEDGNLTSTPPDMRQRREIGLDEIQLGAAPRPAESEEPRTGVVAMFNQDKGYGFITDSAQGERVFVHANDASEPIREGLRVSYRWQKGPKGLAAVDVNVIK